MRKKTINYPTNRCAHLELLASLACSAPVSPWHAPGICIDRNSTFTFWVDLLCPKNHTKKTLTPQKKHVFVSSVLAMGQEGSEKRWGDHCQYITLGSAHLWAPQKWMHFIKWPHLWGFSSLWAEKIHPVKGKQYFNIQKIMKENIQHSFDHMIHMISNTRERHWKMTACFLAV